MLSLMHMQGQAWYLSPPFVVMALTDDDIPDTARLDLASVLGRNLNPVITDIIENYIRLLGICGAIFLYFPAGSPCHPNLYIFSFIHPFIYSILTHLYISPKTSQATKKRILDKE